MENKLIFEFKNNKFYINEDSKEKSENHILKIEIDEIKETIYLASDDLKLLRKAIEENNYPPMFLNKIPYMNVENIGDFYRIRDTRELVVKIQDAIFRVDGLFALFSFLKELNKEHDTIINVLEDNIKQILIKKVKKMENNSLIGIGGTRNSLLYGKH